MTVEHHLAKYNSDIDKKLVQGGYVDNYLIGLQEPDELEEAVLQARKMFGEARHPIWLPKCSPLTSLIIEDVHTKLCHAGPNITLAKLRERMEETNQPVNNEDPLAMTEEEEKIAQPAGDDVLNSGDEGSVDCKEPPAKQMKSESSRARNFLKFRQKKEEEERGGQNPSGLTAKIEKKEEDKGGQKDGLAVVQKKRERRVSQGRVHLEEGFHLTFTCTPGTPKHLNCTHLTFGDFLAQTTNEPWVRERYPFLLNKAIECIMQLLLVSWAMRRINFGKVKLSAEQGMYLVTKLLEQRKPGMLGPIVEEELTKMGEQAMVESWAMKNISQALNVWRVYCDHAEVAFSVNIWLPATIDDSSLPFMQTGPGTSVLKLIREKVGHALTYLRVKIFHPRAMAVPQEVVLIGDSNMKLLQQHFESAFAICPVAETDYRYLLTTDYFLFDSVRVIIFWAGGDAMKKGCHPKTFEALLAPFWQRIAQLEAVKVFIIPPPMYREDIQTWSEYTVYLSNKAFGDNTVYVANKTAGDGYTSFVDQEGNISAHGVEEVKRVLVEKEKSLGKTAATAVNQPSSSQANRNMPDEHSGRNQHWQNRGQQQYRSGPRGQKRERDEPGGSQRGQRGGGQQAGRHRSITNRLSSAMNASLTLTFLTVVAIFAASAAAQTEEPRDCSNLLMNEKQEGASNVKLKLYEPNPDLRSITGHRCKKFFSAGKEASATNCFLSKHQLLYSAGGDSQCLLDDHSLVVWSRPKADESCYYRAKADTEGTIVADPMLSYQDCGRELVQTEQLFAISKSDWDMYFSNKTSRQRRQTSKHGNDGETNTTIGSQQKSVKLFLDPIRLILSEHDGGQGECEQIFRQGNAIIVVPAPAITAPAISPTATTAAVHGVRHHLRIHGPTRSNSSLSSRGSVRSPQAQRIGNASNGNGRKK